MIIADHGEIKLRELKIKSLIDLYHQTYKDIVETITDATLAGKIQKARTMATIRAQLEELGENVDDWVKTEIPQYYLDGANVALQDLKDAGVEISGPKGLVAVNKESIAYLVDETRNAFATSMTAIAKNSQA